MPSFCRAGCLGQVKQTALRFVGPTQAVRPSAPVRYREREPGPAPAGPHAALAVGKRLAGGHRADRSPRIKLKHVRKSLQDQGQEMRSATWEDVCDGSSAGEVAVLWHGERLG